METLSQEILEKYLTGDIPLIEQYKIAYMLTLSTVPDLRIKGEELYCRAEEKQMENNKALPVIAAVTAEIEDEKENRTHEVRDIEELQKQLRTLANKLRKANSENLKARGEIERLKTEIANFKTQSVRDKEKIGDYCRRIEELEEGRSGQEAEIESLKLKLEQSQTCAVRSKEESQRRESINYKELIESDFDLAAFQGRRALIFAERDQETDIRLSALGIIPIWAMKIDWNRPRRRMSTCELILYKNSAKLSKKLNEIKDIARYRKIPCIELNYEGGCP